MSSKTDSQSQSYTGNLMLPLVVFAVTMVFFYLTFDFPEQDEVGPAVVPYLWMFFTSVFCLVLAVQAFKRKGKPDPVPGKILHVLFYAGWMVLYLIAVQTVGFYLSTFVFLTSSMYLMGYRKMHVIVGVAAVWLVFSYFIFARLLFIPLPLDPILSGFIS